MILLYIVAALLTVIFLAIRVFMRSSAFGWLSKGKRLDRIHSSPNFREGRFQNLHHTPNLTEDAKYWRVMYEFFFTKDKRNRPEKKLPSRKTNLYTLDPEKNILVWFGHSSYFMQIDGMKFLVDPVFSGHASPFSFTTRSYDGTDIYTTDDIPDIDCLIITHDHWDHLDHATVTALRPKIKRVLTGLGTGAHLERWGYEPAQITELDWYGSFEPGTGFRVTALPARHFSGRGFKRDQVLWSSFALRSPSMHIYLGGDSGYDTHFSDIGKQHGPFDLAILECGQYNRNWKYIHMMPEELIKAAKELQATNALPVHWAKFSLGLHAWDEPVKRVTAEAEKQNYPLLHPMIGEEIDLKKDQAFTKWWEDHQKMKNDG